MPRLVAWNCNQALGRKVSRLLELRPDVAVISECADPRDPAMAAVRAAATSYAWVGRLPKKGLGIFGFGAHRVVELPRHEVDPGLVLPVRVEGAAGSGGRFSLLGVWAQAKRAGDLRGYVEAVRGGIDAYADAFRAEPWVVAGDLNSSALWDKKLAPKNHASLVDRLAGLGLVSVYHAATDEAQGAESRATYFHRRKPEDPFHIDHVFVPEAWASGALTIELGAPEQWLQASDHMPVVVDL